MNGTFTEGKILCLDQVTKCVTKVVEPNDTCASYLTLIGNNLSEYMLRSWNPTFGYDCGNLESMVGKLICIGPPGLTPTSYTEKIPEVTVPPTSISTTDTLTWSQPAEITSAPTTTANTTEHVYWPPTMPIISTVTGTPLESSEISAYLARVTHCAFLSYGDESWTEGLAGDEWRPSLNDLGESCEDKWDPYCNANLSTPILPSPTNIPSSCYPTVITVTSEYVNPPAPTQSGSPTNCNKWHVAASGDTCDLISATYNISKSQLTTWNPSINEICSNILAKFAYCVRVYVEPAPTTLAPPGPTATGTNAACYKWHVMKSGDTCESIASTYGIIVGRFRQLNRDM
ncbi:hypothetical protein VE03_07057 [Pseudogymnoascus sp. 23342-1-I1]|nr:hypothetical protein VE03_07057 [Pseudogymnoascus sp. 23342-1-I1]